MTATKTSTRKRPIRRPPVVLDAERDDELCVVIPTAAATLAGFREWSASDAFPERGKITFLDGEIIVDMSPERIDSHGSVKSPVCVVVGSLIMAGNLGKLFIERTRFVHEAAGVSNEPEALFISWEALTEKRIRKIRSRDGKDSIEFEGTPDWVLEIVSPSSVFKDTVQLRERYHRAGIPEYWLIDAREERLDFTILIHHADGYRPAPQKAGWQKSKVFGKRFRLIRFADPIGEPDFRLEMK